MQYFGLIVHLKDSITCYVTDLIVHLKDSITCYVIVKALDGLVSNECQGCVRAVEPKKNVLFFSKCSFLGYRSVVTLVKVGASGPC
jgi:hypothetical protein